MRLIIVFLALCATTFGSDAPKQRTVPPKLKALLAATHLSRSWDVVKTQKPLFLRGDFDGNGTLDYAVWLSSKQDGLSTTVAVILNNKQALLFSTEEEIGNRYPGNDWSLHRKREAVRARPDLNDDHAPPHLRGDAIYLEKEGSSAALVYWRKRHLHIYWLSD